MFDNKMKEFQNLEIYKSGKEPIESSLENIAL